jgi:presenilin-like A22 family membrane protease
MKHSLKITIYMILVFLCAQLIGIAIINSYIDHKATETSREQGQITFTPLPYNIERPPSTDYGTVIYIIIGVVIGTVILLLIARFKQGLLWKIWFFLSVVICLSIALSAFINPYVAFGLAVLAGIFKVFKPNMWVHNITEVFLYGGIAAIFVPILNVPAALILLLLISGYDMYAVWYSKHMVTLAEFQKGSKVFAGVMLPTQDAPNVKHTVSTTVKKVGKKTDGGKKITHSQSYAILGGGDIAFPLLFTGVVMKGLMIKYAFLYAFFLTLCVTIGATIALGILFILAKKDRYYPAMPFLTAGCLIGWAVTFLF